MPGGHKSGNLTEISTNVYQVNYLIFWYCFILTEKLEYPKFRRRMTPSITVILISELK